jgi:hypothetical protein
MPRSVLMFNVNEIDAYTTQLLVSVLCSSMCHIFALPDVIWRHTLLLFLKEQCKYCYPSGAIFSAAAVMLKGEYLDNLNKQLKDTDLFTFTGTISWLYSKVGNCKWNSNFDGFFSFHKYKVESLNRSQMDIKHNTCDILIWKKNSFLTYPLPTLIHLSYHFTSASKPEA